MNSALKMNSLRSSQKKLWPLVLVAALLVCFAAPMPLLRAEIRSVAVPFAGDVVESWEEFPVWYVTPPLIIFGGQASIAGPNDYIWQTASALATPGGFGLGPFEAQAQDGTHGYGSSVDLGTVNINFQSPITGFGGYWGCAGNPITLEFYGENQTWVGSDSFNYASPNHDGSLQWNGWQSSVPLYSISYSGAWVVNDSLRITEVPEPDIGLLLGFGMLARAVCKDRFRGFYFTTRSSAVHKLRSGPAE